eukprot:TRINITY_DN3026_c0_g1_i1.p1 TRINITY_DN3026_c0_g1~~TRINITY_DN3026_c0_g1_i1.p1  ORF type:complete len:177 (+),score=17.67 TRINITY_DN3026_c0_g1_i1:9-539(+)
MDTHALVSKSFKSNIHRARVCHVSPKVALIYPFSSCLVKPSAVTRRRMHRGSVAAAKRLLHQPTRLCAVSFLSSSSGGGFSNIVVDKINHNIEHHRNQSLLIAALFATGLVPFWTTFTLFSAAGIQFSGDVAFSYLVVRSLKRFRLPADAATGALLAKLFPVISKINMAKLMMIEK